MFYHNHHQRAEQSQQNPRGGSLRLWYVKSVYNFGLGLTWRIILKFSVKTRKSETKYRGKVKIQNMISESSHSKMFDICYLCLRQHTSGEREGRGSDRIGFGIFIIFLIFCFRLFSHFSQSGDSGPDTSLALAPESIPRVTQITIIYEPSKSQHRAPITRSVSHGKTSENLSIKWVFARLNRINILFFARKSKIKTICHLQREQCAYIKNIFSPALLPYLQKINWANVWKKKWGKLN